MCLRFPAVSSTHNLFSLERHTVHTSTFATFQQSFRDFLAKVMFKSKLSRDDDWLRLYEKQELVIHDPEVEFVIVLETLDHS